MQNTVLQRIMTRPPITIGPEASLQQAAETMLDVGVGSLLVVDAAGRLIGIVTDGDFAARPAFIPFSALRQPQVLGEWLGAEGAELIYKEARRRTVADVMTKHVYCVNNADRVEDVLRMMMERNVKHVPVVDDGGRSASKGRPERSEAVWYAGAGPLVFSRPGARRFAP